MAYSIDTFFDLLEKHGNCCSIKKIHTDPKKIIIIAKICDSNFINNLYNNDGEMKRPLTLDANSLMVITYLPVTTKIMVNLFCCNFQMIDVYDKISTHGIAIEGNFNINPVTQIPYEGYLGKTLQGTNIVRGVVPNSNSHFLVIDDHKILKIMNGSELLNYKASNINIQCVQGERLIEKGNPNNTKILDRKSSMIVVAIDNCNNILFIFHPQINKYNMISLLLYFRVVNAINICDSDNAHLIWKEYGRNIYNKTDFIGNTYDYVANSLVFSS